MAAQESTGKELVRGAGFLVSHLVALCVGVVLMIAGVAMGVSLVLLPIGIPVGLAGLFVFLWGLFGRSSETDLSAQRPTAP